MQKLLIVVIAVSAVLFGLSWVSALSKPAQQVASVSKDKEASEPPHPEIRAAVADNAKHTEEPVPPAPSAVPTTVEQEPVAAKETKDLSMSTGVATSKRITAHGKTSLISEQAVNVATATSSDMAAQDINRNNMARISQLDKFFEP